MSFLKNIFETVLGRPEGHKKAARDQSERPRAIRPPEVIFDSSVSQEAHLLGLWREHGQAVQVQSKDVKGSLQRFFAAFVSAFNDWQPTDPPFSPGGMRRTGDQVQGCSFGHPRAVLMAAVAAVHDIPSSFVQVARKEHASAAEMRAMVDMSALEVLAIAVRSQHNRQLLSSASPGLHSVLSQLVKMAVSRLNTDTATLASPEALPRLATRLDFLTHLLAHALAVMEAHLHQELHSCATSPPVSLGQHVEGSERGLCCWQACEPGSLADTRAMEAAVQPWLAEGAGRGALMQKDAGLKHQILLLQAVCTAVKYEAASLQALLDVNGLAHVSQLLQWLSLASTQAGQGGAEREGDAMGDQGNSDADGGLHERRHSGRYASTSEGAVDHLAFDLSAKQLSHTRSNLLEASQQGREAAPPASPPLRAAYAVLEGALGLKRHGSQWMEGRQQQNWQGLMHSLVRAAVDVFTPKPLGSHTPDPPLHAAAVQLLEASPSPAHHHFLAFLQALLQSHPAALLTLKQMRVWDIIYSTTFFFVGVPASPTAQSESLSSTCYRRPQRDSMGNDDNEVECRKLLDLIDHHLLDDDIILLAAPALARVLSTKPEVSVDVLQRCEALGSLAAALKGQAHAAALASEGSRDPSEDGSTRWQARFAVLSLLATFLRLSPAVQRRAVREWDIVKALFALLWERTMERASLRMVISLMRIPPAAEDDRAAKATLFTNFVCILPRWLAAREWNVQGVAVISDLLGGIREVTGEHDSLPHQNLFRDAEVFVQLVNLLSVDYPAHLGAHMAEEVLSTLVCLLRGNEANRQRFRGDIGYEVLLTAVSGQSGGEGGMCPRPVLEQMLCLALEADYRGAGPGLKIVNTDAALMQLHALVKAGPEDQHWGLEQWVRLLPGSTANLAAFERAGVNGLLIDWFKQACNQPQLQSQILRLLQVTGAYSISGSDLRSMLALLRKDAKGRVPAKSRELLRTLCIMAQHEDPAAFFSFEDEAAGILRNTELPLASGKGYTFAVWLRLESVDKAGSPAGGRSLYSLLSIATNGSLKRGLAAAFRGDTLVVRTFQPRAFELPIPHKFAPRRWYHVAIVHSGGGALSTPAVSLFVDGAQVFSDKFKYPKAQQAFNVCSFGASIAAQDTGLAAPVGAFLGQLGCIYLFDDTLSAGQVAALHELGPNYQSTFFHQEYDARLEQLPSSNAHRALCEGKEGLAPKLALSYNAQAAAGRMLYDTREGDTAALAEGTQLCRATQLRDMLACLGGVPCLLPLIAQLDSPLAPEQEQEQQRRDADASSLAVDTMELLSAVFAHSPANRRSMQNISGMALVSHLLQQCSPRHLDAKLLTALVQLHAAVFVPGDALARSVRQHLLLKLPLWSRAPVDIQMNLLTLIHTIIEEEPQDILSLLPLPSLLDSLRDLYSTAESTTPVPMAHGATLADLAKLRQYLVDILSNMLSWQAAVDEVQEGLHTNEEEMQALIAFVGNCSDTAAMEDGSYARAPWSWAGEELELVREIVRGLGTWCICHRPQGWECLDRLACLIRSYTAAGVLEGFGLMEDLLADVALSVSVAVRREMQETQALAASAGDSWTVVPMYASPHFLANVEGLYSLMYELISGTLVPHLVRRSRASQDADLNQWLRDESANELHSAAWAVLGCPEPFEGDGRWTPGSERLCNAAWALLEAMRRAQRSQEAQGLGRESSGGAGSIAALDDSEVGQDGVKLRLSSRMLLLNLRDAPVKAAQQSTANFVHLMLFLCDCRTSMLREQMQLLQACCIRMAGQQPADEQGAMRRSTLGNAIVALGEGSSAGVGPALPLETDPLFWPAVQARIDAAAATKAARVKLGVLGMLSQRHREVAGSMEAGSKARLQQDRRLCAEFTEAGREALEESYHWKLDRQEDPLRRRMRLKRNYRFQQYSNPAKGDPPERGMDLQPQLSLPIGSIRRKSIVGEEDLHPDSANASPERPEQVKHVVACQLVTPRRIVPGTLRITTLQLDFNSDPEEGNGDAPPMRTHKRWAIAAIKEVHHARFLLQPSAMELFLHDRSNALLNFSSSKVMREAGTVLLGISKRIALYDRKRKQDEALRLQGLWVRWELSTFDYLMRLNTLAGRTYNDLNQYPVFPWVLADYESPTLDLTSPETFRDLSKPVGALNPQRLQFFKERYESFSDPDIPAFHYGSHYSSAGVVLFYLIRMEPFTSLNRALQGDRFDHADRLFHDIASTWANCLQSSSDVKELVPEFFYQADFLTNANGFDLGCRQDGVKLGDAVLPPWANDSPDEFRGSKAKEAVNVFYYLTYEGAADLDDIADPLQRKAVEDQISFFGQTPSQLFKRAHPKRGPPPSPALHPLLNCPDAMKLNPLQILPSKRPNASVACLRVVDSRLLTIGADRAICSHKWVSARDNQPALTFSSSMTDSSSVTVEQDPSPARMLGTPFAADLDSEQCHCVLPAGQVVVSCGFWDNSLRCYGTEDGRLLQTLRHHKDIVTCVALASSGTTLVSGSRDTTLLVWEVVPRAHTRMQRSGLIRGPAAPLQPLKPRPRLLLTGHESVVVCVVVCTQLDLIVSASAAGAVLVHSLGTGRYIRCMYLPDKVPPRLICLSPTTGVLLAHSWQDLALHAYSVNGRHLVSAEGTEKLSAVVMTPDGKLVISGGARGIVTLRWLHSLQVILRYEGGGAPVTALALSSEECIVAGTARGALLLYVPDPRRRITRRLDQADVRSPASPRA
ncbi:hypothetical protein WJX73_003713 [Symbiochloris irregularis]|uniref:Uncharacterized protein n=1 Tax=Symbiochloris irregularis TaxID=706552 RepID=A0AAW1PA47_9CHLO